jgi:PAS domain S-box-containing protein
MTLPTDIELYRAFFDKASIGFVISKMDGTFLLVNEAYAAIHGRSVEETKGLRYTDFTPMAYDEEDRAQIRELVKTGRCGPFEKMYIHKNGSLVSIRLTLEITLINNDKYIWAIIEKKHTPVIPIVDGYVEPITQPGKPRGWSIENDPVIPIDKGDPETAEFQPAPLSKDQDHEVTFAFDQQSYKILHEMQSAAGLDSDALTVREALRIMRTLQQQAEEGFKDVIVQNDEVDQRLLTGINVLVAH